MRILLNDKPADGGSNSAENPSALTATITEETEPKTNQPENPENEPTATGNVNSQGSIGEKIGNVARGVFDKFGVSFKKGRGRPRKDGQPGKADVVLPSAEKLPGENHAPVSAAAVFAVAPVGNSTRGEIFRKACCSSVKGTFGILAAVVKYLAGQSGISDPTSERILKNVVPEEGALNDFTDSLDAVLKKRNIEPENAEEIALAINAGRLLAPFGVAIMDLRTEIARQREARESNVTDIKAMLRKIADLEKQLAETKKAA